jgi:hypothetical protein
MGFMMKKCSLLIAVAVIVLQLNQLNLYGQITYNVSKPLSYNASELTSISELPILHFQVDERGNANYTHLAQDINSQFLIEKYSDKNIARLKFKVEAKSLGEMSLIFKDVKLKNGSHCYVYTNDYQIIAGPIYEKSINGNLQIMKLPASELILEVVYDNASEISFTFNGVSFSSLVDLSEKKKKKNQILGEYDNCHNCDYDSELHANINYNNNIDWFGAGNDKEIFKLPPSIISGIVDKNLKASRSACQIIVPTVCSTQTYTAVQGTLMNFPYEECEPPNQCGYGFIFTAYHLGVIQGIVQAQHDEDTDYLDKILIRFNWHHEYGIPYHLESSTDFNKWRETINFDEVIDYCGVEVFAYRTGNLFGDLTILKMKQMPFFKEYHLGWTTQVDFDTENADGKFGNDYLNPLNKELFGVICRRTIKPTLYFDNIQVYFDKFKTFDYYYFNDTTANNWNPGGLIPLSGYSGGLFTFQDYDNANEVIGLGLVTAGTRKSAFVPKLYGNFFDKSFTFFQTCDTLATITRTMDTYLNTLSMHLTRNFLYTINDSAFSKTHKWYPSAENEDKCSSLIGMSSPFDSCRFNFMDYVTITYGKDICIRIDDIPFYLFPYSVIPSGYRIYLNTADQKTLEFKTFTDNIDVQFPIEFCIDQCDILYLMSKGIENLSVLVDFYDSWGKVFRQPNCKLEIMLEPSLCDMLDVSITPAGEEDDCCKYDVTISVEKCPSRIPGWGDYFNDLVEKLSFQTFEDEYSVPLSSLEPGVNTSGDFVTISFSFTICSDLPENEPLVIISYDNGLIKCDIDSLTFDLCSICDCPDESIMASWVTVTTVVGEAPCGEDKCKVVAFIDIPDLYNDSCYTDYAFNNPNNINPYKRIIPPDGRLEFIHLNKACLEKGEFRQDTLYLYKGRYDENPCTIITSAFCSVESFIEPCSPDCLEVEWNKDTLDFEVADCPGCRIYATYLWRHNTCEVPVLQELQVTSFATHGDTLACMNCLGLTPDRINKLVVLQAIHENNMGFKPITADPSGDCDTTWRVLQASCWAKVYSNFFINPDWSRGYIYIPCDDVECCSIGLRVCRFPDPPDKTYITTQTIGNVVGADSCEHHTQIVIDPYSPWVFVPDDPSNPLGDGYLAPNYNTYQCEDRCSALYSLDTNGFYGAFAKPIVHFDIENIEFDGIQVTLNKTNDYIEFVIHALQENNNLKLSLYSLLGEELISERLKFPKGLYSFKFNTSNIHSGIYLISIESNGMHIQTDKYLKVK